MGLGFNKEHTINGKGYILGVDLGRCEDSSTSEPELCFCHNPNGFQFLGCGDDYQIWLHMKCGGQLTRPLIKS